MARAGIDAQTGRSLFGWDHCLQSIITILTTELGECVQLRDYGSTTPRHIDRPQTAEAVLDIYMATAQALEPRMVEGHQMGEPGFVLLQTHLDAGEPGKVRLHLAGVFFENGHLGDYSNPVARDALLSLDEVEGRLLIAAA